MADDWHPDAPQVGDHQLSPVGVLPGRRVDHLADELALVQVDASLRLALEAPGADLASEK
jgi:hypothetical protein